MIINPLFNKEFLKEIDKTKQREVYVKITALDFTTEAPKESIEGKITGGSLNIDGSSATRRTCSLTLVSTKKDTIITDSYWVNKNKFKLEFGLTNTIDIINYPNIIWFKQGIFVITNFSYSETTNNFTINISGSDKMCLLDGKISGKIPMEVNFGVIEETNTSGITTLTKIPLYTIIQEALLEYAKERLENITINDLDENGYELWEYRGNTPLYMLYDINKKIVYNITLDGSITLDGKRLDSIEQYWSLNTLDYDYNNNATIVSSEGIDYAIIKLEYGDTAGYHSTELVYAGDLILKAGETITSLLDKIKSMLGDYEYFYDINGKFVFQKKKTYMQELFTPFKGSAINPSMIFTAYGYEFENDENIVSKNFSPTVLRAKNDFSIWGKRSNSEAAIHGRYAIHKKPTSYTTLPWVNPVTGITEISKTYTSNEYDWRELIYRMAIDYYRHRTDNNFLANIEAANIQEGKATFGDYIGGITSYEPFYSDMQAFWRLLYNPDCPPRGVYNSIDLIPETTDYEDIAISQNNLHYYKGYGIKGKIIRSQKELDKFYYTEGYTVFRIHNRSYDDNNSQLELDYASDYRKGYWYFVLGDEFDDIILLHDYTTTDTERPGIDLPVIPVANFRVSPNNRATIRLYCRGQQDENLYNVINLQNAENNTARRQREYDEAIKLGNANEEEIANLKALLDVAEKQEETMYKEFQSQGGNRYDVSTYNLVFDYYNSGDDKYWNKAIHTAPETLIFWIDFLDTEGELNNFSINKIGYRSTTINDQKLNSIYYPATPEVLYVVGGQQQNGEADDNIAYTFVNIPESMQELFGISSKGNSITNKINEVLYDTIGQADGLTLTAIPIYYLEPNIRIKYENEDYILTKISYQLTYNSTMSLTCTKVKKYLM